MSHHFRWTLSIRRELLGLANTQREEIAQECGHKEVGTIKDHLKKLPTAALRSGWNLVARKLKVFFPDGVHFFCEAGGQFFS